MKILRALRRLFLRRAARARERRRRRRTARNLRSLRRNRRKANLVLRKMRHRRRVARTGKALTWYDGKKVATWIVENHLKPARRAGYEFTVTSGWRSDAKQVQLYLHPQGYPVAKPRSLGGPGSKHNGKRFPDGAADLWPPNALDGFLAVHGRTRGGTSLDLSPPADSVHYSHHDGAGY